MARTSRYTELNGGSDDFAEQSIEYEPSTKEAPFVESEPELSLWAAVRRYPKIVLWSLALMSTIILWGYDFALVGSASSLPVFQEVYGEKFEDRYIIPSSWFAGWNVASPIGMMIGAVIAGWLGDKIGRKKMIGGSTLLSATAVAICYISDLSSNIDGRRGIFFFGKFIQGICIGALCSTTQTYMSETVPSQLRGTILAVFPIFVLLGQVIGSVVIQVQMGVPGRQSYRVAFASQWAFGVVPIILAFFLPESPAWLIRRSKIDEAKRSHLRLEGSKTDPFALASFGRLQAAISREKVEKSGLKEYLACFKGSDGRRTFIVIFANMIPELFGMTLLGNASYFLQTIGVSHSMSNLYFIIGIVLSLVGNLISMWSLSRFGRRTLIIPTLAVVTVLWGTMGIAGSVSQGTSTQTYSSVLMSTIIFIASLGAWPGSYVISSEASSLRLRAKTQGVGWFISGAISCVFGMAMPYLYNNDAAALGGKMGYVFVGFAGIATAITFWCVPEMKGRSIEELDRMYELGLKTREFKRWRSSPLAEP